MGKNQTHKAMQASKRSGGGGGGLEDDAHGVDASFHTAEWHAARLAALQVERPSYEDWKLKQKEAAALEMAALEEQDRLMREYKEGLAQDRAKRLGIKEGGVKKHQKDKKSKKSSSSKKKKKKSSKDKKHKRDKKHSKKKKHRRHSSSSSSGGSSSDSGSSSSDSDSDKEVVAEGEEGHGPVKLSEYLWGS